MWYIQLKQAFRNLRKNATYTFLNIAGLAVGLAAGTLILLLMLNELSYDRFHTNLPNLHVLLQDQASDGEILTFDAMPGPLAADLKREFPEITNAARGTWPSSRLMRTADNKLFQERSMYAEPSFLDMFTFPAVTGDPRTALADPGSIVITEKLAKKLFGSQNPIGQPLNVNNRFDYRVAAILKDVPANSSIKFDALLPFAVFEKANAEWITRYGNNSLPTWIETAPGTDLAALNGKLYNFIQTKNADAIEHVHAWPFAKWRLEARFKNGQPNGGRIDMLRMLCLLGVAILMVACINFMNLATARSALRAREVGVRKAVGAGRARLIGQFLGEAMLLSFMALSVGLLLAWICLPAFNRITEKDLTLLGAGWPFWASVLAVGLVTGFVAGSYPAFFLSKFNPVRVLKNDLSDQKSGGAAGLRRGLVVAQFAFSTFLMLCTIFLWQQINHLRDRPLGFDKENLLFIPAGAQLAKNFDAFRSEVQRIPGVRSVSCSSDNLLDYGSNTSGMGWPGKTDDQQFLITVTNSGTDYMRTVGIKIKEGRDFEGKKDSLAVILNEAAVKRMGLKNPLGQYIEYDTMRPIIGVIEDFVQNGPDEAATPSVFFYNEDETNNFFVRMENSENWSNGLAQIEAIYKKMWPNHLFQPRFVAEECEKRLEEAKTTGLLANVFGGMSILISCLGLFGLAAFTAERRTKEIGVRKVLGASVANITGLLTRDFLKLVAIAIAIALPIGFYAVNEALTKIEYRIEVRPWVFALTAVLSLAIAFLTVSFQSVKAALANPVKSLRSE